MDISVEKATEAFKCSSPSRWTTVKADVGRVLKKQLQCLKEQIFISRTPSKAAVNIEVRDRDAPSYETYREEETNRIYPDMCLFEEKSEVVKSFVRELDRAINYHQSEHIVEARKSLKNVFQKMSNADVRSFEFPTGYGMRVLDRGKELFLKGRMSCSVKHGTLLLDSSSNGAQFYVGLLNVVGAFAVTISEYQLGKEIFSMLISLHRKVNITSHLRDLGAAYNNAGCISMIEGDLKQAEFYFKTSWKNLKSAEKLQQFHNLSLEVMFIAVQSNISRLSLISRNFGEALQKQEQVVESCKAKKTNTLPHEVVFTVLNNQAVLHTTLTNFGKAEEALKYLISYCIKMNREDCDFLLNFVSLHLCEVLLLSGKSQQAEKAFNSEVLTSARGTELALMFGGLHINVRTESFEKFVDVLVHRGKVKFACDLLEKGMNVLKKSFGPDHFNVASLLYKQGKIFSLIGDFSSSVEKFKCSIAILEEMFGVTHPLVLKCFMSLGDVALKMKREDESYYYFHRAMENIEVIYQVSFVSQLSRKYVKMTKNGKYFHGSRMTVDRTEGLVEDLVAEHGLAFAVLLSRLVVQDNSRLFERWKTKGKQPLITKGRNLQSSEDTMEIISLKRTRDFLHSGKTFLRHGMAKEAAVFFQQAAAIHAVQGHPNPCLTRLYSVLTKKLQGSQVTLEDKHDLLDFLEELSAAATESGHDSSSEGTKEETAAVISDCHFDLKLVLIFIIQFSMELKMIDTTFAAYDLYAKLSQNDDSVLLFLSDGVQFYASRTSITCNGKTAMQDVLVSSTEFRNGNDSDCRPSEKQLFRNLACKKNVPIDSFLVSYNSSRLLDIDDLQLLERKISLSVQECFQLKCFETKNEDIATQVAVDLSVRSTSDLNDALSTDNRIALLSLCLSEEANDEISQGENISEISTAICKNVTRLTFEDEQTSSFIFRKHALSLLQQFDSGKISSLSVHSHGISLKVIHPVKAQLTLWQKDKFIEQKVLFVRTISNGPTNWKGTQQMLCGETEERSGPCSVEDRLFWPPIDHLVNTYRLVCRTDTSYFDEPVDVSDVFCEQNGILLHALQSTEECSKTVSQEEENDETIRQCVNSYMLESLNVISDIMEEGHGRADKNRFPAIQGSVTVKAKPGTPEKTPTLISDKSRQLPGDETKEDEGRAETNRFSSSSQSQLQHYMISSSSHQLTLNPEAQTESQVAKLEAPGSVAAKAWTPEETSTPIVDVSRQLPGEEREEGDGRADTNRFSSSLQSQLQHELITSSSKQSALNPEAEVESQIAKLEALGSVAIEAWTPEESPMAEAGDDDNGLGKSLFEEDRKLRRSIMAKIQQSLKKKETTSRSNFLKAVEGQPEEVIHKAGNVVIDPNKAETHHMLNSRKSQTRKDLTKSNSKQPTFNTEADERNRSLTKPCLHGGKQRSAGDKISLGRHYFEEDRKAKLQGQKTEEISSKSDILEYEDCFSRAKTEKNHENEDVVGDPCYDQTLQEGSKESNSMLGSKRHSSACEKSAEWKLWQEPFKEITSYHDVETSRKEHISSVLGTSGKMSKGCEKRNIIKTTTKNLKPKVGADDTAAGDQSLSGTPFSGHGQTQFGNQSNLQEVRTVEIDETFYRIKKGKDYMEEREGGETIESKEEQSESLTNECNSRATSHITMPKTETSRSSNVYDDTVPDRRVISAPSRNQSNANDLISVTSRDFVDGPLKKAGNTLQIQSGLFSKNVVGMWTSGRRHESSQNGKQSNDKTHLIHHNKREATFLDPLLGHLGGDFHVDGDKSDVSRTQEEEEEVVDGPVAKDFSKGVVGIRGGEVLKIYQDDSKKVSGNETTLLPVDAAKANVIPSGFGGARPKKRSANTSERTSTTKTTISEPILAHKCDDTETFGIYPPFLARHTVKSNGAILEVPLQDGYEEPYFSAKAMADGEKLRASWGGCKPPGYAPHGSSLCLDAEQPPVTGTSTQGDVQSLSIYQKPPRNQKESWHFPPPVTDETADMQSNFDVDQRYAVQQHSTQTEHSIVSRLKARLSSSWWRSTYNEMDSMTNEYHNSIGDDEAVQSPIVSAGQQSSTEDSTPSLLGSLQEIMAKTVTLIASRDTDAKQSQQEPKEIEKVGVQEEARGSREQEQTETTVIEESRNQEKSSQENQQTVDTERQSIPSPVQETPRPVCSHYQRRCLVRFPCCGKFYPCHRCHNESEDCSDDQARAINATHIRCTICYHEQAIDEQSQHCGGCKSKMSEYFCAICKHFTSVDKNPFHCGKCGICRIHKDRSFHCDVCNVCLDKRLQGKHKCRPDSGHDECCICLEDAFSGCQILPCSHKVHKDCAIAMIQNGVRTCPICRHPLFSQPQNIPQ